MRLYEEILKRLDAAKNPSEQISGVLFVIAKKFDELEDRIIELEEDSDSKQPD